MDVARGEDGKGEDGKDTDGGGRAPKALGPATVARPALAGALVLAALDAALRLVR